MWNRLRRWLARPRPGPADPEAPGAPGAPGAAADALFTFQWRNGRWLERLHRDRYPLLRALPETLAEAAVRGLRREAKAAARDRGRRPEGD